LEAKIEKELVTHDQAIAAMLAAIRELMRPAPPSRRSIGFTGDMGAPKSVNGTEGGLRTAGKLVVSAGAR
jgi:hypothetical protein